MGKEAAAAVSEEMSQSSLDEIAHYEKVLGTLVAVQKTSTDKAKQELKLLSLGGLEVPPAPPFPS